MRMSSTLQGFIIVALFGVLPLTYTLAQSLIESPTVELKPYTVTSKGERPWRIMVQPDPHMAEILRYGNRETLEEASDKVLANHKLAGPVIRYFVDSLSDSELEHEMRLLTRRHGLRIQDLSSEIQIIYLANGWNKTVYLVQIKPIMTDKDPVRFILKMSKDLDKISEKELNLQSKINRLQPGLMPYLGRIFKGPTGYAYFEEYIEGLPPGKLFDDSVDGMRILRKCIKTWMDFYRVTQYIPTDMNASNLIVENHGLPSERIVILDLNHVISRSPRRILERFFFMYALQPKLLSEPFSEVKALIRFIRLLFLGSAPPDIRLRHTSTFLGVIDALGEEEGVLFLREGFERLEEKYPNLPAFISARISHAPWQFNKTQGAKRFWILLKRNIYFTEYVRSLADFLSEYP